MKLLILKDERGGHILGVTYKGLVYTNTESIISVFEKTVSGVLNREGIKIQLTFVAKRYEVEIDNRVNLKLNLDNNIYFVLELKKKFHFIHLDSEEDDEFAIKNTASELLWAG